MPNDLVKASKILGAAVIVASIIIVVPLCVMMSQVSQKLSNMKSVIAASGSGTTIVESYHEEGLTIKPSQTWPFYIKTRPQEPLKVEIVRPEKK